MAKLPDGMIFKFCSSDKGNDILEVFDRDLIVCKHCASYDHETGICTSWGSWTDENGYCFKAKKRKEDIVALDFSEDIDTPSRYQTSDGEWHEGMIGGD